MYADVVFSFVTFRIEVEVEAGKQSDEAMHSCCWDRGKLPPLRDSLVGHGFSRDLNGVIKRVPSNPPTWSTPREVESRLQGRQKVKCTCEARIFSELGTILYTHWKLIIVLLRCIYMYLPFIFFTAPIMK